MNCKKCQSADLRIVSKTPDQTRVQCSNCGRRWNIPTETLASGAKIGKDTHARPNS